MNCDFDEIKKYLLTDEENTLFEKIVLRIETEKNNRLQTNNKPKSFKNAKKPKINVSRDIEKASKRIEEVLTDLNEILDYHTVNDALSYAQSTTATINSFKLFFEARGFLTEKQFVALDNIQIGAKRWLDRLDNEVF